MSGSMFQPPTFGQAPTLPGPAQSNLAMFGQAASAPPLFGGGQPAMGAQPLFNAAPQMGQLGATQQQPDYSALFQALAQHPAFQQLMQPGVPAAAPALSQGIPQAASFQPQIPAVQQPQAQAAQAVPPPAAAAPAAAAPPPTGYAQTYPMDQWIIDATRARGLPTETNGIPWAAPGSPQDRSQGIQPWNAIPDMTLEGGN